MNVLNASIRNSMLAARNRGSCQPVRAARCGTQQQAAPGGARSQPAAHLLLAVQQPEAHPAEENRGLDGAGQRDAAARHDVQVDLHQLQRPLRPAIVRPQAVVLELLQADVHGVQDRLDLRGGSVRRW
jgi:hypothetical protein